VCVHPVGNEDCRSLAGEGASDSTGTCRLDVLCSVICGQEATPVTAEVAVQVSKNGERTNNGRTRIARSSIVRWVGVCRSVCDCAGRKVLQETTAGFLREHIPFAMGSHRSCSLTSKSYPMSSGRLISPSVWSASCCCCGSLSSGVWVVGSTSSGSFGDCDIFNRGAYRLVEYELSMIRWPPRQQPPLVMQYHRASSNGAGGIELPAPAHRNTGEESGSAAVERCVLRFKGRAWVQVIATETAIRFDASSVQIHDVLGLFWR
jgi:hypothetical protein